MQLNRTFWHTSTETAARVAYSTTAVEADLDVLVVAQSKSILPTNSNRAVRSDVPRRPATYWKTAEPGLNDSYCKESYVLITHISGLTPKCAQNRAVRSDVPRRPATYWKTAEPGLNDSYCKESYVLITHISGLTPKCAQPYVARRRSSRCCFAGDVLHTMQM